MAWSRAHALPYTLAASARAAADLRCRLRRRRGMGAGVAWGPPLRRLHVAFSPAAGLDSAGCIVANLGSALLLELIDYFRTVTNHCCKKTSN